MPLLLEHWKPVVLLYRIIRSAELALAPSGYATSSDRAALARCAADDESCCAEFVRVYHNPATYAAAARWLRESAAT